MRAKPLFPFQQAGVERLVKFLKENDSHAAYLADEQGLGKTAQTVRVADALKVKRVLVVCPAIARLTWQDEVTLWRTHTGVGAQVLLEAKELDRIDFKRVSWLVVSYNATTNLEILRRFVEVEWDLLVFDESHFLKTPSTKRSRACLIDLWGKSAFRLFLSGTPLSVSAGDLYTACNRCSPEVFASFHKFVERYAFVKHTPWGAQYFGLKNADELKTLMYKHFFVRRTKEEVMPELPARTWSKVTLPMRYSATAKLERSTLKLLSTEADSVLAQIRAGTMIHEPRSLAEYRRLQGVAKVPAVVEYAKLLLDENTPLIIFAHHKAVVAALAEGLGDYDPRTITGATPPIRRKNAVRVFQSGNTNLLIANLKAGGVAITLTRANIALFAEVDYSAAVMEQAACRIHRIGTSKPCTLYYFAVQSTLDYQIANAVMSRIRSFRNVTDAGAGNATAEQPT